MADYNGSFIVVNGSSNQEITNVNIVHTEDGVTALADSLGPGQATQPKSITSNGTDNWDVNFKIGGVPRNRSGKECGLESEDNNEVCVLILYPENFSVVTPQSDGCYNNAY